MNELQINDTSIEEMIYEIRGKQVMLDSDLAKLYQCANGTKTINQAVKRHTNKFPERFMFKLTPKEFLDLQSQFGTAIKNKMSRTEPYVFTEQGVAMLATIIKTSVAEEISIKIMDAFVLMRKYIATNTYSSRIKNIETKIIEHDNKFNEIFSKLEKEEVNHIFFEGQIYDAYSLLIDLLNSAKKEIIIIDNYIDKKLLDITSKIHLNVQIITSNKLNKTDLNKYNEQYNNLKIRINNSFHDRFIILDREILYHSGASFKDLGKKCFSLNKIEEKEILKQLLEHLKI